MDKRWVKESRVSPEFEVGLERFLDFAFERAAYNGRILCPCDKCCNVGMLPRVVVRQHILLSGFDKGYMHCNWGLHGETTDMESSSNGEMSDEDDEDEPERGDDMHGMLEGVFGYPNMGGGLDDSTGEPNAEAATFYKLVEDADRELYPGCKKFNKLSFIVRLFQIKCLYGWSDVSFSVLLDLLKEAFPEGESLPNSFYLTKKIIGELGIGYEKIDACPNDCMLYWKEASELSQCTVCQTSRWKTTDDNVTSSSKKKRKVAAKILRHFPIKPRLQRLFMSSKTAGLMRWHAEGRNKDGVLRHPADTEAWATLDNRYPDFAEEIRNVRLGLSSDGFNPFGTMSSVHSTWPVVLMPYNLPP